MSVPAASYYRLKSPVSILNRRGLMRGGCQAQFYSVNRAFANWSLRSAAPLLLAAALFILLTSVAQAQRQAAAIHIVRPGETLGLIAQNYGVEISALASANGIINAHSIRSWQELTIPGDASPRSTEIAARGTHIVRRGESLGSIAELYGITVGELIALNNISGWVYAGDEIALPVPNREPAPQIERLAAPAPSPQNPAPDQSSTTVESSGVTHTVRRGESLSKIAAAYGVSLTDLQALNNVWASIIHTGLELKIPAGGSSSAARDVSPRPAAPAQTAAQNAPASQTPSRHTVQRGETLFRIATRYGMSVASLMSINGITDPTRIHAGNQLRLSQPAASAPPPSANPAERSAPAPAAEAQAAAPQPPAPAPVHQGDREHYIVKRGDFLTQLGIDLDTSWIALAKLNNLENPNNLHVGTTLLIPKREDVERYDPEYAAWKWFDMIGNQPGARVGVGREIVIVLGTQSTYAYENGILQKAVRVSTGKRATPTIQGDHKVWLKRRSQTMSGPGYSLDNVEWVMYFYLDYAIHGTWWHMNFGQPMSHGCVNLTNADAEWFFNFADIGTPVHVRV